MIERISQSFIKTMREYEAGIECGNIVREQFVNDRYFDDEEPGAKELGSYFEFLLSGAIPKNGQVPQPIYMSSEIKKNGGKTDGLGVKHMYEEYRLAHANADRIREYLSRMGLKIVKVGQKYTKGRFDGIIDLVVEVQVERTFMITETETLTWTVGQLLVIDMKYSGLISKATGKFDKHGWNWTMLQKEYHGTQAIQYHFITGMPFYFLVVSSTNDEDCELFYIPVDDAMVDRHIGEGNYLMDKFLYLAKVGFVARPSLKKCISCPLKDECDDKHLFPHPRVIDLNAA